MKSHAFLTRNTYKCLFKATSSRRIIKGRKILVVASLALVYACLSFNEESREIGRFLLNEGPEPNLEGHVTNHQEMITNVFGGKNYRHSPYMKVEDIIKTMPEADVQREGIVREPSHIQLCREFLQRSEAMGFLNNENSGKETIDEARALIASEKSENVDGLNQHYFVNNQQQNHFIREFRVDEDQELCEDWVAPHYSILQMFASYLIASVGSPLGLRYRHYCRKYVMEMHNNPNRDVDYTTIQAILPENLISRTDVEKIDSKQISTMCGKCISDFEAAGSTMKETDKAHQCLMMPIKEVAEQLISDGKEVPFVYAMPSIINILRHTADDWIVTTTNIKGEDISGAIIAIDGWSKMMNYSVYDDVMPPELTSIQILASSNCALASVNGNDCIEHGRRLKRYFLQTRPNTYIRYDVVGSSAASYTRMIKARILVCPPGTVLCLLPAIAKRADQKSFIAEDSSGVETFRWFENHVLAEKMDLGLQETTFDTVEETDYLKVMTNVSLEMSLDVIGEGEENGVNATDHDLDDPAS